MDTQKQRFAGFLIVEGNSTLLATHNIGMLEVVGLIGAGRSVEDIAHESDVPVEQVRKIADQADMFIQTSQKESMLSGMMRDIAENPDSRD